MAALQSGRSGQLGQSASQVAGTSVSVHLDYNDLIIKTENGIVGCHLSSGYIITGVGCTFYDPEMKMFMLANEYNKQQAMIRTNNLSFDTTYYEDFGGKLEPKHEWLHICDVILGELFEETATLFNLHFEDFKTCIENGWYVPIPSIGGNGKLIYLCCIIPLNMQHFKVIQGHFEHNYNHIKSKIFDCQKQFLEIDKINFFLHKDLEQVKTSSGHQSIKNFYGTADTLYSCKDVCQSESWISSRFINMISKMDEILNSITTKRKYISVIQSSKGGLYQFVSQFHLNEINNVQNSDVKAILPLLQKYYVPKIPRGKNYLPVAIGGDIPFTYYNDIKQSLEKDSNYTTIIKDTPTFKIETPRLIIYTTNPCAALSDSIYMNYNGQDITNLYLHKWFNIQLKIAEEEVKKAEEEVKKAEEEVKKAEGKTKKALDAKLNMAKILQESLEEAIKVTKYEYGVLFHLNEKLYFSYKAGTKYKRCMIGIVKLLDDTIITYNDIVYKQALAVEAGYSFGVKAMELLKEWKSPALFNEDNLLQYFDDGEIERARRTKGNGGDRFATYAKDQLPGVGNNRTPKDITLAQANLIDVKGYYHIYDALRKNICDDGTFPIFGSKGYWDYLTKPTKDHILPFSKSFEVMKDIKQEITRKLSRSSDPYEFDCDINSDNPGIFTLKENEKFVMNGITFASEATKKVPNWYLTVGMYDCYIINETTEPCMIPLYRLKPAANPPQTNWECYRVAYECIFPPNMKFEVISVKYQPIIVTNLNGINTDEIDKDLPDDIKGRYWKRIITVKPYIEIETKNGNGTGGGQKKKLSKYKSKDPFTFF